MRTPFVTYRHDDAKDRVVKTLEVIEYPKKYVGITRDENGNEISRADFYEKDGDKDLYRVCEYFGFNLDEKIG